jgi:LPS export ABC transporter protein LptC
LTVSKKHKIPGRIKRGLLAVIFISLCGVIFVFSNYRSTKAPAVEKPVPSGERPSISIRNFQHSAVREGVKQWIMNAESARIVEDEKQAVISSPVATFYLNENEKVHLTANQGFLKTDTNDIQVTGNVIIENEDYKVFTEEINYQNHERRFISNAPVKIIGMSYELAADSMWFNLSSDTAVFHGNVRGFFSDGLSL